MSLVLRSRCKLAREMPASVASLSTLSSVKTGAVGHEPIGGIKQLPFRSVAPFLALACGFQVTIVRTGVSASGTS